MDLLGDFVKRYFFLFFLNKFILLVVLLASSKSLPRCQETSTIIIIERGNLFTVSPKYTPIVQCTILHTRNMHCISCIAY